MDTASMPTKATRCLPSSKTDARTLHGSCKCLVEDLAVSARLFHADVRRDVALGKADPEQRLRRGRPNAGHAKAQK